MNNTSVTFLIRFNRDNDVVMRYTEKNFLSKKKRFVRAVTMTEMNAIPETKTRREEKKRVTGETKVKISIKSLS